MINMFVHYYRREHLLTMSKNLFFWILGRIIFINSIYFTSVCLYDFCDTKIIAMFYIYLCKYLLSLPSSFFTKFSIPKDNLEMFINFEVKNKFPSFPLSKISRQSPQRYPFKQHLCNSFLDAVTQ